MFISKLDLTLGYVPMKLRKPLNEVLKLAVSLTSYGSSEVSAEFVDHYKIFCNNMQSGMYFL